MHEVLVNRLGGLSLPRKSVVRLNDRLDMTLDVYRGRKTSIQQHNFLSNYTILLKWSEKMIFDIFFCIFIVSLPDIVNFSKKSSWIISSYRRINPSIIVT